MSVEVLLLIIGALAITGFVVWIVKSEFTRNSHRMEEFSRQIIEAQKKDSAMEILQREVNNLREQVAKSMAESARMANESQKTLGERLDRAAEVVGRVQKSLGSLDETTKQVLFVGKDIAQLQEILRAPKMRGAFGELFLGDLLAQILTPKNYSLQYAFKSGEIVDAVVKLGRLVPIDAKFPLENFKRLAQSQDPAEKTQARRKFVMDVKRHIDAISSKYLLPDEGTFDFALMYIPAENVYYETIVKDDYTQEDTSIINYAFSKRVVPVSPNSFYAYLHTISLGLRGLEIEENARHIIEQLGRLRIDFSKFREDFGLLGKHLSNSRSKYEDAEKRLDRFEDKLLASGQGKAEDLLAPTEKAPPLPLN